MKHIVKAIAIFLVNVVIQFLSHLHSFNVDTHMQVFLPLALNELRDELTGQAFIWRIVRIKDSERPHKA